MDTPPHCTHPLTRFVLSTLYLQSRYQILFSTQHTQHSTSQTLISRSPTYNMPQVRVTIWVSMALHPGPAYSNVYGQRSFMQPFTTVWNGLPQRIRALQSITAQKGFQTVSPRYRLYKHCNIDHCVFSLLSAMVLLMSGCYVPVMCCM